MSRAEWMANPEQILLGMGQSVMNPWGGVSNHTLAWSSLESGSCFGDTWTHFALICSKSFCFWWQTLLLALAEDVVADDCMGVAEDVPAGRSRRNKAGREVPQAHTAEQACPSCPSSALFHAGRAQWRLNWEGAVAGEGDWRGEGEGKHIVSSLRWRCAGLTAF